MFAWPDSLTGSERQALEAFSKPIYPAYLLEYEAASVPACCDCVDARNERNVMKWLGIRPHRGCWLTPDRCLALGQLFSTLCAPAEVERPVLLCRKDGEPWRSACIGYSLAQTS